MIGQSSVIRPPTGGDADSSKLLKLFLAEKLKTSLVIIRISRINILLGILLFIALTIGAILSWERSTSSMISGYFFSLLLIGIGVGMLSVYGNKFKRNKKNDKSLVESQDKCWVLPSLRKQNEIESKVLEDKVWFWSLASLILVFSSAMCLGEAGFLALGLDNYAYDYAYKKGLCLGLSSLFILTSVLTFAVVKLPGRKMFLTLFLFGLLSLVGSVVLTVMSAKYHRNTLAYIGIDKLTRSTEDTVRNYFSHDADGHVYYPYWPYFHLVTLMCTPAVTIIVFSFALMVFCLNVLILFKNDKIHNFEKIDSFDVSFVTAGISLPIVGFGVHLSCFVLSNVTASFLRRVSMAMEYQNYFGFFLFAFTGLASLICLSQPRRQFFQFILFLLSIALFAVSIFMIIQQTQFHVDQELNSENRGQCKNSNNTNDFCLRMKSVPSGCQFYSSSYRDCQPKITTICIPMDKRCDGVIDLLPFNETETFFTCENEDNQRNQVYAPQGEF